MLDIAGGAGGLAFELTVRHGIPCLVVDERVVKLNGKQQRFIRFQDRSRAALEPGINISSLARNMHARFAAKSIEQHCALLDSAACMQGECPYLCKKIQNCSVLVGLHPDQATDHIINCGLYFKRPWVVVPCCVFPKTHQHRKTASGSSVRTYDELCEYILGRDPGIQEVTLDFNGRNRCFFWHPK